MKNAPRNVFMALYCLLLFMQNLTVLGTSTISYSFSLDFGGVNSAEKTPPSPGVFTRTGYFLALQSLGLISICTRPIFPRPCSAEIREHYVQRENTRWKSYGDVRFLIHMVRNLMTQRQMDVMERRILKPDKFSKASGRNLWSFFALAKKLVGAEKLFALEMADFWPIKQNFLNFA